MRSDFTSATVDVMRLLIYPVGAIDIPYRSYSISTGVDSVRLFGRYCLYFPLLFSYPYSLSVIPCDVDAALSTVISSGFIS